MLWADDGLTGLTDPATSGNNFSTARSRALADRGLASTLAADGVHAPRFSRRASGAAPHTHGRPGGQVHPPSSARREAGLDDPVLARVVGDGHAAATRSKGVDGRIERHRQDVESWLTSMRNAWNVRLAGCPPRRRAGAGMAAETRPASCPVVRTGPWTRSTTARAMREA